MSEEKDLKNEESIDEIKKQAAEYLAGWQRAKADFINYKKDIESRESELVQFAVAGTIMELLPIYEALVKAANDNSASAEDWRKGIVQLEKKFANYLADLGIKQIKTVGEKFNHDFHEAVGKRKDEGREEGIILEEAQAGFMMGEKVMRPAKVIVNG